MGPGPAFRIYQNRCRVSHHRKVEGRKAWRTPALEGRVLHQRGCQTESLWQWEAPMKAAGWAPHHLAFLRTLILTAWTLQAETPTSP